MKKRFILPALFLSALMVVGGCGAPSSDNNGVVNDPIKSNHGAVDQGTENKTNTNSSDAALAEEAYKAFLNMEEKVVCENHEYSDYIENGKEYSLSELLNSCTNWTKDSWDISILESGIMENRVDIGNDGIPEMALKIYNDTPNMGRVDYVFVIKLIDGKLQIVSTATGAYRSYAYINEAGIVVEGGSGGASNHFQGYYYASPDGKETGYYSVTEEGYARKAIVPWYYLETYPDDYPMYFDDEIDDLVMKAYVLGNGKDISYYFVFEDYDGNTVECEKGYEQLYAENHVSVVTQKEVEDIIQKMLDNYSVKYEQTSAPEIEWNELDVSKYENIYGNDWVSSYKNFLSDPANYRDLLTKTYEIAYGYDAVSIAGFTIADVNFDGTPELIFLMKDTLSNNTEPMVIYGFDKATNKIERKVFVASFGSEANQYVTEYYSMPEDSFAYGVANNCYSYAGLYNGKFILFSNFGDGFANFEMSSYDIDNNKYDLIYNEWMFLEGERSFGADGDRNEAQNVLDGIEYLYFVDINQENIDKYVNENYKNSDITSKSGIEVYDMLRHYVSETFIKQDNVEWTDGYVVGCDYIEYSYKYMVQIYSGWDAY